MSRRNGWMIVFGALVLGAGLSMGAGTAAGDEGEVPAGQALFVDTHKCNMCHAVPAAGIEAKTKSESMKGADLGGQVDVELATLAAFLRKETERDGKEHKKEFKGTDEELQSILDWLGSLEAAESSD